ASASCAAGLAAAGRARPPRTPRHGSTSPSSDATASPRRPPPSSAKRSIVCVPSLGPRGTPHSSARTMRVWLPVALIVQLVAMPARARRDQPGVIAAGSELVELDVVALNREGAPVTDLGIDDFQVKEDGRVVEL